MGIKFEVDENFFKKWSPKMSYLLGYLFADGSLENAVYLRGKYLRVSSIDERTILKIKKWLNSKHTVIHKTFPNTNRQDIFLLRIGSHLIYNDLLELGLFPNKSLNMRFPKIPKKYLNHFVLGYFDGDGCVQISRALNKKNKKILKGLRVTFTCGSSHFLNELARELRDVLGIKKIKIYNGHRSFILVYPTSDSVKLFKLLYNNRDSKDLHLKRKFDIFCKYFAERPTRRDGVVNRIIYNFNLGRVAK